MDGIRSAPAQAQPPAPRVPRSVVSRRQRVIPAPALPVEPPHRVNGDLNEDEALQVALQESRRGHQHHPSPPGGIIEIPDDEEQQQDSPVSAVAPLLERMSIAPSHHRTDRTSQSRSRSVTLCRSLSPGPSPTTASQKRSLDHMHDGEADEVMKEGSPPKRERVSEAQGHQAAIDDGKIASKLPQYAGPQNASDADDEDVVVGRSKRGSGQNGSRNARVDGSVPEDRDAHRSTAGENNAPKESAVDWSRTLSQTRNAENSGDETWTF